MRGQLEDGRTVEGSHALMTVGSVPNTDGPGPGGRRRRAGRRPGFIEVDRVSRTTAPGVYAAGDVTGVLPCSPRSPPCRAGSRCGTRSARRSRRSGSRPSRPTSSPTRRSPPSASRRSRRRGRRRRGHPAAAGHERAGEDAAPADGFVKLFCRPLDRRGHRRRRGRAGGLGADPADRDGGQKGLTVGRPGADLRDLPVAVRLDHRGRPAADGDPGRPQLTVRARCRPSCGGVHARSRIQSRLRRADGEGGPFCPGDALPVRRLSPWPAGRPRVVAASRRRC